MRVQEYGEIFEHRGLLYDAAMTACPEARAEEFARVVAWTDPRPGELLCDVPAGGGYLRRYVPDGTVIAHVETSLTFARLCRARTDGRVLLGNFTELPLRSGTVHRMVSLAALHHVTDKHGFFREAHRMLRPGGVLCVADVAAGSRVADFLNGFVDAHNPLGHRGMFLGGDAGHLLETAGFTVRRTALERFSWHFRSASEMAAFVRPLFGIEGVGREALLDGIAQHLDFHAGAAGCALSWELLFLLAAKPEGAGTPCPAG